jgi:hypothetical protein
MIRYGLVGVGSYHGTISLRGNIYASRARYGKPHYRGRYRLSHYLFLRALLTCTFHPSLKRSLMSASSISASPRIPSTR